VLEFINPGLSKPEIGEKLYLSESMVKNMSPTLPEDRCKAKNGCDCEGQ